MNNTTVFFLLFLFTGCTQYGQLQPITQLPKKLGENSGIASINGDTAWFIEDSGNPDKMYQVDLNGQLLKELKVKNAKNRDWEDLAKDSLGNIYIGDFGNNENTRKDLVIYKVPNPEKEKGDHITAEAIQFFYPEQKKFPPKKSKRHFGAEAFFYHQGFLYIITKNRARPFHGEAFIYKVPAKKGNHRAFLVGSFISCTQQGSCEITSADISPDGKKIVLISNRKLWLFTNFSLDNFSKGMLTTTDLPTNTQMESVCFKDNNTLWLSDEQHKSTGRNLYTFSLK
ncbi:hypothetical protein [Spongiimicrobium salis]|uniref:hypothetical protein n=1 Tax=Spongiimicrobium salis TaxID=1667022 RepID=UPI00374CFD98